MGSLVIPFQIFHSEFDRDQGRRVFFVLRSAIELIKLSMMMIDGDVINYSDHVLILMM